MDSDGGRQETLETLMPGGSRHTEVASTERARSGAARRQSVVGSKAAVVSQGEAELTPSTPTPALQRLPGPAQRRLQI
ncbi:hypothetical protein NDU88_004204 [Pleurodeles waltl]|uniref:Uncharacterized protein n=1 Tax=Pleurodeles waltl TaxID=8319 RepID=A0AAV7V409_PLEWA|nr:hypothetical protein NDU88_004204 [Pleurodeles waltl]